MLKKHLLLVVGILGNWLFGQSPPDPLVAFDSERQTQWVDSVYNALSLEEKVGQLFMVAAYSNRDEKHTLEIDSLIKKYHLGGLIFFQGGPVRQAKLSNYYQSISKVPLLIGMDLEWGLSMRLDSTYRFPYNMTLGAIQDKSLLEALGKKIGEHTRRMGVHINFAPVLDINTNPENPIIGNRSYGENPENVIESATAFVRGMQSAGVLTNGKHFPGHGDTATDSHKTLPIVPHDRQRLDSVELKPYRSLFSQGLSSVMVAHLEVPALEPREGYPSSVSYNLITNLLKDQLGFKGLIFTDALNMKGITNFNKPGDIDLSAFLAGNDVLLFSENVPVAVANILDAYQKGFIDESRLALSVKKILKAKYLVGLNRYQPVELDDLLPDLNDIDADVLHEELYENILTLLKNKREVLPVNDLTATRIAYVKMGDDDASVFVNTLKKYTRIDLLEINTTLDLKKLKPYDLVIIGYHKSDVSAYRKNDFSQAQINLITEIAEAKKTVLAVFARPYVLSKLNDDIPLQALILAYQNNAFAQSVTAQAIFGALPFKGKIPVSVSNTYPVGSGLETTPLFRLSYGLPEQVGLDSRILSRIDTLATAAVEHKVAPGMQVLVARKGKVVYAKNFGYHTYEKQLPVTDTTVYDLASLTKILATLPMIMKAYQDGKISMNTRLGALLPELKNSNKRNITVLEILSHYGRLKPWIPFYTSTLDNKNKPSEKYYRTKPEGKFNIQVAKNLYVREDIADTMYQQIADSPLQNKLEYKYSDLPFLIFKKYLEDTYNKPLEDLTQKEFYQKLGANFTTFRPLEKMDSLQIPPTEKDNYFRHQTVRGYVHDMAAAMLNGVGGHAGLFSNANDIAKIMQMYVQGGYYGGQQFLDGETIGAFNSCHYCARGVRRGIGFDKPQIGNSDTPTCGCVSMESFGHQGFTGTFAWADPESEIVYVFLSNRTFPDASVNKLSKERIRERIQQIIYDAIYQ